MIWQVAIVLEPTEIEKTEGKTDKILLPPTPVSAERQFTAVAKAVLDNADAITKEIGENGDIARARIQVVEFGTKS
jgi:hypothetical protein